MRAGKLRKLLTVQQSTETKDDHGQPIKTWADFATMNGSIEPLSGREFMRARQVQADVTHSITLRYLPGVVPKMRVKFGTRIFHIESVLNIEERNRELSLLCKETIG